MFTGPFYQQLTAVADSASGILVFGPFSRGEVLVGVDVFCVNQGAGTVTRLPFDVGIYIFDGARPPATDAAMLAGRPLLDGQTDTLATGLRGCQFVAFEDTPYLVPLKFSVAFAGTFGFVGVIIGNFSQDGAMSFVAGVRTALPVVVTRPHSGSPVM